MRHFFAWAGQQKRSHRECLRHGRHFSRSTWSRFKRRSAPTFLTSLPEWHCAKQQGILGRESTARAGPLLCWAIFRLRARRRVTKFKEMLTAWHSLEWGQSAVVADCKRASLRNKQRNGTSLRGKEKNKTLKPDFSKSLVFLPSNEGKSASVFASLFSGGNGSENGSAFLPDFSRKNKTLKKTRL